MSQETARVVEPHASARRTAARLGGLSIVVLAILFGLGALRVLLVRSADAETLRQSTRSQQDVYVLYTTPKATGSDGSNRFELPGTLTGWQDIALYARSSGYVKRWSHDIGERVRRGEVLAVIETPELERQIEQAHANVRQVAASLELARTSLKRWEALRKDELVTQQELEERSSTVDQQAAALASAQAELSRLESLHGFDTVVAPFDGVIVRRNVEVGRLVNAGTSSADQVLFELASSDRLRLEIYVPQTYADGVQVGMDVAVTRAEQPGVVYHGHVARTSKAIDTSTRTLQVEVEVPNADGRLLPGTYVQARLPLIGARTLSIPPNALLFRAEGPRVASVDAQGSVHLLPVTIGRDLGKSVEILTGLQDNERVVLNPPDALAEGDRVQARPAPVSAAAQGAGKAPGASK